MDKYQSFDHTQWERLYHVVFIPKSRRHTLYVELRKYLIGVFNDLVRQKESTVEEVQMLRGSRRLVAADTAEVRRVASSGLHEGKSSPFQGEPTAPSFQKSSQSAAICSTLTKLWRTAMIVLPSDSRALSGSIKLYLGLVAFLVAVKVVFLTFPTVFPGADQEGAFHWTTILVVAVMGFVGLVLAPRAGFPAMRDERVSTRQRYLVPAIVGFVYGLQAALSDLPDPSPVHLSLPLSIPFYAYGAVLLEVMLRLFGVTLLTWLISGVVLRGRWQEGAFWVAAVATSLYEPMPLLLDDLGGATAIAVPSIFIEWATEPLFIANLVSAYLYRKYGFLAALVMRLSFYSIWHVLYGGVIAPFYLT
jgi:hypothetical protein